MCLSDVAHSEYHVTSWESYCRLEKRDRGNKCHLIWKHITPCKVKPHLHLNWSVIDFTPELPWSQCVIVMLLVSSLLLHCIVGYFCQHIVHCLHHEYIIWTRKCRRSSGLLPKLPSGHYWGSGCLLSLKYFIPVLSNTILVLFCQNKKKENTLYGHRA